MCEPCLEAMRQRNRARQESGLCRCGAPKAGRTYCADCASYGAAARRALYKARRDAGLCPCGRPLETHRKAKNRTECQRCSDARKVKWARKRENGGLEILRRNHLRRLYGMTLEEFEAMLAAQGGRCAICSATEAGGKSGRWHVDHDHLTGSVRGILCHSCNVSIGHFKDDPMLLLAAAEYLIRHQER